MRQAEIQNDKLADILTERGLLFRQIGKINEQLADLDKERTKIGYKMDKLKDKTAPIVDKHIKELNLGEFEIVSRVYLNGEQTPEVEIIDLVEEYTEELRKKKADK